MKEESVMNIVICEILGFHGGEDSSRVFLGCDVM